MNNQALLQPSLSQVVLANDNASQINTICPYCASEEVVKSGHYLPGKQRYICRECQHQFSAGTYKRLQPFTRANGSLIVCPDCGTSKLTKASKKGDFQGYKCKTCNRQFQDEYKPKPEKISVPDDLTCPDCDSSYLCFKTINRHRNNIPVFECLNCHRMFQENSRRRTKHESPFPCPDCGGFNAIKKKTKPKDGKERTQYHCKDCKRFFCKNSKPRGYVPTVDPETEYEKDIWDIRNLGIAKGLGTSTHKLNFFYITQPWLRQGAKHYIRYSLSMFAFGTCLNKLQSLRAFSYFLNDNYPSIKPNQINKKIMRQFVTDIKEMDLSDTSKGHYLSGVKNFLELSAEEGWADTPKIVLIDRHSIPRQDININPRFIPLEVVKQLNHNLDYLPPPVIRMVLVIQDCGMRVSELCQLKFDCLTQDTEGDFFLHYYQFKMRKDHTIPVSRELATVIQEQQAYIRKHLGDGFQYLFCARKNIYLGDVEPHKNFLPVGKVMGRTTFNSYLKRLAEERNIKTTAGTPWDFTSHQFRHTVGTNFINNGVPPHIVQRILGHTTAQMTMHYSHIHEQTLKEEYFKYRKKVVDIQGSVYEPDESNPVDGQSAQWLKKNVGFQALPNGTCALSILQICPHANACLTCSSFRTTVEYLDNHKQQLEHTKKLIDQAATEGWKRQEEMNRQVAQNLQNIISSLEEGNSYDA